MSLSTKLKYEVVSVNHTVAEISAAKLSDTHITQFGYVLNRIQATIDHFNNRLIGDCTQQVADILGLQLEEIREAAQKHRA